MNMFSEVLKYSTWHITVYGDDDIDVALFAGLGGQPVKMPDSDEFKSFLNKALEAIAAHVRQEEYRPGGVLYLKGFSIKIDGILARCQESIGFNGVSTYALRLTTGNAPRLDDLGMPQYIRDAALNPEWINRGGLITIFGAQGSGKTWSAYALLLEYLTHHGGSGFTIEDPIEFNVQGWIGEKGYLTQTDCTSIGYHAAIVNSLRFARSVLLIGEIRDSYTAAEMLRIALGGQLVITTVHAKDHVSVCQRIVALAQEGGEPQAAQLLANSLLLSIGQRINQGVLQASMLIAAGQPDVRQAIVTGDYTPFVHALERQRAKRDSNVRQFI